jgi:autotransporter translocation and assembly factor TamB
MIRQVSLAFGVAGLAILALLLAVVRSKGGGDRICAVAEAVLEDVSGQEVSARCEVDPIATRVTIRDVRIGPPAAPIFRADRISAGVDQRGFLSGRIRIDQVEIVNPRVSLDLSHAPPPGAGHPLELRPPGAACLPDLGRVELGTVTLQGGSLLVLLPEGRQIEASGMSADLTGDGERLAVKFQAGSAAYADPAGRTAADRAVVRGEFDLNGGTAHLDAVDLSGPAGSVFVEGALTSICRLEGSGSVTLRADLGQLHEHLLRKVENLSGQASLQVHTTFSGQTFDATGRAEMKDSKVLTFTPGSFTGSFHLSPGKLEVTDFDLPLDSGKLHATGDVILAPPFKLSARAKVENLVLGELLERLGARDLPVELRVSGSAKLSGPVAGPKGPALDVELETKVAEFGVYDRSFRRRREPGSSRFVGFDDGSLAAAFRIGNHAIEISHARVEAKGSQIDVAGSIGYEASRGLHLQIDSPQLRVEELGPFGPARCEGTGEFHGLLAGPYAGLDLGADARIRKLRVQGLDIGDVSARMHLDLVADTLEVTGARGTHADSSFTADGRLSFIGRTTLEGRVSVDGAQAEDLLDIVSARVPSLRSLRDNLDATVTGDAEISGPTDALDLDARLALSDVRLFGQRFDRGALRTSMRGSEEVRLSTLELDRGDARVRARGSLRISDRSLHLDVASHGLEVGQIDAIASRVKDSTGDVSLRLTGSGTLDHPVMKGLLVVRDWRTGVQPIATAQLALGLDGTAVSVDGALTSPWPLDIPRPPHEAGRPWPLPPGSMVHDVHATADLSGDMPFSLRANLSVPDVRDLLPADQTSRVRGALAGTLTANGALTALPHASGELQITRLQVQHEDASFESDGPAVVSLVDGRVTLQPLRLRGNLSQFEASGTREADGRLDFTGHGTLDLAILMEKELLGDDLSEASGQLSLQLSLSGTQARPVFVGTASLTNGRMRLKSENIEVSQANGVLSFGRNVAELESFQGRLNGGPLSMQGEMQLDSGYSLASFASSSFHLSADMSNVLYRWDDTPVTLEGKPTLSRENAGDERMKLGGQIKVVRLHYTHDVDPERAAVEAVEYARRPPTPHVFEHRGEIFNMDLGIEIGDVAIDNNLAKAQIKGDDLRLTGTLRHWGLTGALTIQDGKAYVRNNEFRISSAVVNFTDRSGFKPSFDLRADAQVRNDYLVHITATGTPEKPVYILESEPPLSPSDIVMLLTIGVTSKDAGTGALSGVALDAAYNATGIPAQMKRLLPKNDVLRDPRFDVSTGYNPLTQNTEPLGVFQSRVFRDDLTLKGQTSLLGHSGANKAELGIRLRKNVNASVQWNDDPSAPSSGDFGGDIKLHWEAP